MSVTRGDFIRLSYTGRLDNGDIFDTTNADVAKENDLFAEGVSYAPIVVIAGENMVVTGLDEDLMGKASGYEGQVKIQPKMLLVSESLNWLRSSLHADSKRGRPLECEFHSTTGPGLSRVSLGDEYE